MSIRIPNGLKYTYNNLSDVGKFHRKLINIVQENYLKIYNEKISEFVLYCVLYVIAFHDRDLKKAIDQLAIIHFGRHATVGGEYINDYIQKCITGRVLRELEKCTWDDENGIESLFSLIKSLYDGVHCLFATDPMFKGIINVHVKLFYRDDSVYILSDESLWSSSHENYTYKRLLNITGVEEYEYQNSTDMPSNISKERWESRLDEWEEAMSSFQLDMNFLNSSTIEANCPNQTNVVPFMITTDRELSPQYEIAKEFMSTMHGFYRQSIIDIFRVKMESRVYMGHLHGIRGWFESVKYLRRMGDEYMEIFNDDFYQFRKCCDDVFIPLFKHFELIE